MLTEPAAVHRLLNRRVVCEQGRNLELDKDRPGDWLAVGSETHGPSVCDGRYHRPARLPAPGTAFASMGSATRLLMADLPWA